VTSSATGIHPPRLCAPNLAVERREACLRDGTDLEFETVLSGEDTVDFVMRARAAGFFVRLLFVSTGDAAINSSRIARRVMLGGHEVPIGKIISRYSKSIANCALLASHVDRLYVYDNSAEDADPTLCFRASEGLLTKRYRKPPAWSQIVFERIAEAPYSTLDIAPNFTVAVTSQISPAARASPLSDRCRMR